jgi:tryptophanyl-tRNA synthetase
VSNLLSILAAASGRTPDECAAGYSQYGPLKADTAAAVVELLRPIQQRYAELSADPSAVADILAKGAAKAQAMRRADPGARPRGASASSPPDPGERSWLRWRATTRA